MEDFEIKSSTDSDAILQEEEPERSGGAGRGVLLAVGLLLVLALLGGGYFLFSVFRDDGEEAPAVTEAPASEQQPRLPPADEPPQAPPEKEPPSEPLPRLDESDAAVRAMAVTLSRHPKLARWLATDELIRRFVRVVANVAYGESPRSHVRFLEPQGEFATTGQDEELRVDPRTYARYDVLTEVFVSLDERGVAELYEYVSPLIEQAYRELGYPEASFEQLLRRAVDELLEVPIVEPDVALQPRVISYEFADPALEELTDPQKQLLRMGPTNVRRVQSKLRQLMALIERT